MPQSRKFNPTLKPSRHQVIGWAGSLLLHGGVFFFIAFYAYFYSFTIEGDARVTSSSEPLPQDVRRLVDPDEKDKGFLGDTDRAMAQRVATREGVRSAVEQATRRVAEMSREDQVRTLETHAARIEQIKPRDMDALITHIESSVGLSPKPAQTQPAPASGEKPLFDFDSSRPTDIIAALGPKPRKEPGYLWTLTDAHGLTYSYFVPSTEMTPENLRLAGYFEKARKSPNFSRVLDTAVKMASQQAQAPAATRPAADKPK